jgi:ribonuclease HI
MIELSNINMDEFKIFISGIIEKNTNRCSSAYIIFDKNNEIVVKGSKIITVNKSKEYTEIMALCRALFIAKQKNIRNIIILNDSELLINNLTNKIKCNNELLKLKQKIDLLLNQFINYEYRLIDENTNKITYKLAEHELMKTSITNLNI